MKFMTSTIATLIAVLLLAAAPAPGEEGATKTDSKVPTLGDPHRSDGSYTLVWQDEFSGTDPALLKRVHAMIDNDGVRTHFKEGRGIPPKPYPEVIRTQAP